MIKPCPEPLAKFLSLSHLPKKRQATFERCSAINKPCNAMINDTFMKVSLRKKEH